MLMIMVSSMSGHTPPVMTSSRSRAAAFSGCNSCAPSSVCASRRPRSGVPSCVSRLIAHSSRTRIALEGDGHPGGRVVLAEWVADPVVGHQDARRIRMTGEHETEEVEHLAFGECETGVQVDQARDLRLARGNLADRPDTPVAGMGEEVRHHLEPLTDDAVGNVASSVDEMVDCGDIHALRELLGVAEVLGHVVPVRPLDVDDRLTVRVGEHRTGEAADHGGGNLVGNGSGWFGTGWFGTGWFGIGDFVIWFTSVGVGVGHLDPRARSDAG